MRKLLLTVLKCLTVLSVMIMIGASCYDVGVRSERARFVAAGKALYDKQENVSRFQQCLSEQMLSAPEMKQGLKRIICDEE